MGRNCCLSIRLDTNPPWLCIPPPLQTIPGVVALAARAPHCAPMHLPRPRRSSRSVPAGGGVRFLAPTMPDGGIPFVRVPKTSPGKRSGVHSFFSKLFGFLCKNTTAFAWRTVVSLVAFAHAKNARRAESSWNLVLAQNRTRTHEIRWDPDHSIGNCMRNRFQ